MFTTAQPPARVSIAEVLEKGAEDRLLEIHGFGTERQSFASMTPLSTTRPGEGTAGNSSIRSGSSVQLQCQKHNYRREQAGDLMTTWVMHALREGQGAWVVAALGMGHGVRININRVLKVLKL